MGNTDMRVSRTRKHVKKAFMELIQKKPFSEISVGEICELAECSRNAFYNNYGYKDNLFISISEECINAALSGIYAITSDFSEITDEAIRQYCFNHLKSIYDNAEELRILLNNDYERIFRNMFMERLFKALLKSSEDASGYVAQSNEWYLIMSYNTSGFVGFVIFWLDHPEISFDSAQTMFFELVHSAMFLGEKYLIK